MVNLQQILEWIQSIFKLSSQVQPIIRQIKDSVKIKTINGIEFIETPQTPSQIIQDLNKILVENGVTPIDESKFKLTNIDPEEIAKLLENDFTEQELAEAISTPQVAEQPDEITNVDLDLADVCAPVPVVDDQEFNENEVVEVACEIPQPEVQTPVPIGQIPNTEPVISFDENDPPVADATDENIDEVVKRMSDGNSSDIFDKNGPDCFKKMQEISTSIQKDIEKYNKVKESLQEIQLDYYYQSILYAYYNSFKEGYGELNSLREKGASDEIKTLIAKTGLNLDRDETQEKLEESILPFSSQFNINIDTGFLGLFQSAPTISIDREIELGGKIKEIPDALLSYIDSVDKKLDDASKKINDKVKLSEKELNDAFAKTIEEVKKYSFGFGVNEAVKENSVEKEFLEASESVEREYRPLEEKYLKLKKDEQEVEKKIENIQKEISEQLAKLNCKQIEVETDIEPGILPDFKNVSKGPTIFDYAWWVKFSALATIVNLVPVHWPVGLLIPTPSGIIKVPFPIIWIPLFVAASDKLISVLFIGQCGILPSPFVFFQHFLEVPIGSFESNNPYFIVAMRGPINIRSHKPLPPNSLPSFDLIFELLNAALDNYRKGINVDVAALLSDIKNQFDEIKASANRYTAISEKEVSDIIKNAKSQAGQIVQSAKESAEAIIKQTKDEGEAAINAIIERYGNTDISFPQINQIRSQIQEEIKRAEQQIEEARRQAKELILNSEKIAQDLRQRAQETLKGIIETGKQAYEQKIKEFEEIKEMAEETLKTLKEFINKIKIPAIDLSSIDLTALFESYKLSLGSLKALAADLSPKAIEFGFPKEISPQFSQLLPILDDDFPPWERLTLLNIPFVLFLWKWCQAGKKKGGFFENAF